MEEMKEIMQDQDKENREDSENELLSELVKNSRKQLFYARVRTLASIVIAAAVVICLVILMPVVLNTMSQVNGIMSQASETIVIADSAIESITEMCENMDTFITENAESVETVMKEIGSVDFKGLNDAIKDLGDVIEPLAKFFNRF